MNTSRITTRDLQQKLLGFGLYKNLVDGDYGKDTVAAVKELQTILTEYNLYNFAIDGKFGTRTYEGMLSYIDIIIKQNQAVEDVTDDKPTIDYTKIIYGSVLSDEFINCVWWMAEKLRHPQVSTLELVNDFIGCMAWESAETFSPSIKNAAGSGATGLIQFMPATARGMGTTVDKLAAMTQIEQLNYVYKYFLPYKGKLRNLGDVYMAILWPLAVGKDDSFVLWSRNKKPVTYRQNSGLDVNKDGVITRAECIVKVTERKNKGKNKMRKAA